MKVKPGLEQEFEKHKQNKQYPYGSAIIRYAEAWADLMEGALGGGGTIGKCWKDCSNRADTEGVTAFMYGCAVQTLSYFWEHGEELRVLHNKDCGLGEDAKGVANPAILVVSTEAD